MQTASRLTLTALAVGVAGILAAGQADASGFQIRENSVKNLGRANAGTTVAWGDASVVLNNPAAMSNLKQTTVQADVTVIDLSAKFDGSGTTAVGTPLTGGDGGDPGEATPVPAMAAVFPISDTVTLGASVSAPFGLKTEYDPTWMGRYDAIKSDVKVVDLTLSAAFQVSDRFSIGVGAILQNADVTLSKAIDFGTALCAASNPANCFNPAYPYQPQQQDGSIEVSGDDNAMGWVAGVQFKVSDTVTLGYAHRSKISHDLQGTADFSMPASVAVALSASPAGAAYADGDIHASFDTPTTDTISARFDVAPGVRILADAQRTGWSSLQSVDILRSESDAPVGAEVFEWDDSWFYSIGGEWDLSPALTLRAGAGFDATPTNDARRTPRLPDNDRNVYTFGLTWNATPNFSVDAAYMRVQIDSPSVATTSASGSHLNGKFDGHANLFGISAQYRF